MWRPPRYLYLARNCCVELWCENNWPHKTTLANIIIVWVDVRGLAGEDVQTEFLSAPAEQATECERPLCFIYREISRQRLLETCENRRRLPYVVLGSQFYGGPARPPCAGDLSALRALVVVTVPIGIGVATHRPSSAGFATSWDFSAVPRKLGTMTPVDLIAASFGDVAPAALFIFGQKLLCRTVA